MTIGQEMTEPRRTRSIRSAWRPVSGSKSDFDLTAMVQLRIFHIFRLHSVARLLSKFLHGWVRLKAR